MIRGSFLLSVSALAAGLKPKVLAGAAGAAGSDFAGSAGLKAPPNGLEVSAFCAGTAV